MTTAITLFVLYGGGALVLALAVAAMLGRTVGRVAALLLFAPLLAIGVYAVGDASGRFDDSPGCTDCEGEFFHLLLTAYNGIGWCIGVVVGSLARLAWTKLVTSRGTTHDAPPGEIR